MSQGTVIEDGTDSRSPFYLSYKTPHPNLHNLKLNLYARTAETPDQQSYYVLDESGTKSDQCYCSRSIAHAFAYPSGKVMPGFTQICTISADLSALSGALQMQEGPTGPRWELQYEIGILFGNTELSAVVIWTNPKTPYVCLSLLNFEVED